MYTSGSNLIRPTQQPTTQPVGNSGSGVDYQAPAGFTPVNQISISTPASFNFAVIADFHTELFLLLALLILIAIFRHRIFKTISHLNNKQKIIWSLYLSIILISLTILLSGGNLWKPFMNNDCDYYRFVQWDCIRKENIMIAMFLIIPSIILHKLWKNENE